MDKLRSIFSFIHYTFWAQWLGVFSVSASASLCLSHPSLSHNVFFFNYQLTKENLSSKTDNICIYCLYQLYQTMKGLGTFSEIFPKLWGLGKKNYFCHFTSVGTFLSMFYSLVLLIKTINAYYICTWGYI